VLSAGPAGFSGGSTPRSSADDGRQHILVVDDESAIRLSLHRFLTRIGYRVSVARNGCEGLSVLSESRDVDLVVTDLVMPDYDGRALIDQMRLEHPSVPVLVISGYPATLLPDPGPDGNPVPYLSKPFGLDALAAEIQRLIDQKQRGASR
jgi:CheY-like chemotaxis protein